MKRACLGSLLFFNVALCDASGWLRFEICPELNVGGAAATGFNIKQEIWVRDAMILHAARHKKHENCTLVGMTDGFRIYVKGHVQDVICKILIGQECPNPRVIPE